MKKYILLIIIFDAFLLSFCDSNNSSRETKENEKLNTKNKQDSSITINKYPNDTNYKGIMVIPEQMAFCILDSALPKQAPSKMEINYSKILKDVKFTKVEVAEYPGCIFYSNQPDKIVFETFFLLKTKPQQKPRYSKPVILEKTLGLLYDHYGTFNTIHQSYDKIKKILEQEGYIQSGPTREIYILNDDTSKWRTRIIVPITKK